VIDTRGSHIFGKFLHPGSPQLGPGETAWMEVTIPLQAGTYGIRLDLLVIGQVVDGEQRVATAMVDDNGVELRAGTLPDVPDTSTPRAPTMSWDDEIQIGDASVAGSVTFGDWVRNDSDFDVPAGVARGLLAVIDSNGSQIFGEFLHPASEPVAPEETSWMEVTIPLDAGTYGVQLELLVLGQVVDGEQRVATAIVEDNSVEFHSGSLP
jgi:hypothetical protein